MIVVHIVGDDACRAVPPGIVNSLAVVSLGVFGRRSRTVLAALAWPIWLTIAAFVAAGSADVLTGDQGAFVRLANIL